MNCPEGKIILGGGIGVFLNDGASFNITQSMPKAPIDDDPGYGWTFGVDTDPLLWTVDILVRMMCADQSE